MVLNCMCFLTNQDSSWICLLYQYHANLYQVTCTHMILCCDVTIFHNLSDRPEPHNVDIPSDELFLTETVTFNGDGYPAAMHNRGEPKCKSAVFERRGYCGCIPRYVCPPIHISGPSVYNMVHINHLAYLIKLSTVLCKSWQEKQRYVRVE